MRSVFVGLVAILAACYQPALQEGAPCGPGDACPTGQECRAGICFFTTTPSDASGGAIIDSSQPMIDARVDAAIDAAIALGPWGTPVENASLEISGFTSETDPTVSANRLVVAIAATASAGDTDLLIGTRASTAAGFNVVTATALNSPDDDQCPELSADGKSLWFASNRAGQYDIYISTESSGTWSAPTIVAALSTRSDSNVAVSPDGLTAITLDISGTDEFYLHTRASTTATWSTGTVIPELTIASDIASPTITNNAATIYFHADNDRDIYVSHRMMNGTFSTPTLVTELNTGGRDACPFVLQNDRYMIFDRDGDIFETTR